MKEENLNEENLSSMEMLKRRKLKKSRAGAFEKGMQKLNKSKKKTLSRKKILDIN